MLHNEVHVYLLNTNDFIAELDDLLTILSNEEKVRANRFVFPQHRERFIIAHAILRKLLANYLQTIPEKLIFLTNKYGKPEINNIYFNISHSRNLVAFAFAKNFPVGIDIEFINKDFMNLEIAERFFSHYEFMTLHSLPSEEKTKAFFNCWTRKEAFIKAMGQGLSFPLNQFDVDINSNNKSLLLEIRHDQYKTQEWQIQALNIDTDYAGALAIKNNHIPTSVLELKLPAELSH